MAKRIQGIVIGIVICLALTAGTVMAASTSKTLTAYFNDIKIVVDGTKITPKDGAGNVVEPFIWEGTTYLPVRAVAEALGKNVSWDGNTQTVTIGGSAAAPATPTNPPATPTTQTKEYRGRQNAYDEVINHDFSLPYASRVTLKFDHGFIDSGGNYWKVQFIDKNGGQLFENYVKGSQTVTNFEQAFYLPAGEYFARVTWFGGSQDDSAYTLTVKYEKNVGGFETETNDNQNSANAIAVGVPIIGNSWKYEDKDYYKFGAASAGDFRLEFKHGFIDSGGNYWKISLIDASGGQLKEFWIKGSDVKTETDKFHLETGTYYAVVQGFGGSNDVYVDYTLTINK